MSPEIEYYGTDELVKVSGKELHNHMYTSRYNKLVSMSKDVLVM